MHVHLGKKARVSRTEHGLHSDTPRDKALCSTALFNALKTRHLQGKCQPVSSLMFLGVWNLQDMVSHSMMGMLASPFSLNISASSTLKAALQCWAHLPHGQRWLFPRPLLDKLSGKDELQRSSIICILSAKPKDNHPLRVHPSRSEAAGSCCLLLQGKNP